MEEDIKSEQFNGSVPVVPTTENELYISKDKGNTWTIYSATKNVDRDGTNITSVNATKNAGGNDCSGDDIDVINVYTKGDVVYACSSSYGLYVSKNNGASWINYTAIYGHCCQNEGMHKTGILSNCVRDVCVDGNGFVYVATDKGVSISFDNCAKWTNQIINGDDGQNGVNRIAVGDGNIYAATTDNGIYTLVFSSGGILRHDKNTADSGVSCVHGIHVGTSHDVVYMENYSSPSNVLPVYISCTVDNKEKLKVSYDCGLTWITIVDDAKRRFNRFVHMSPLSQCSSVGCIYMTATADTPDSNPSSHHGLCEFMVGGFYSDKPWRQPTELGVCAVACGGNFVYTAAMPNGDVNGNEIYVGEVLDVFQNISWNHYTIPLADVNPYYAPISIKAMAASSSGTEAYAVFSRGTRGTNFYATSNSGVDWTHVNNFNSSVSAS